MKAAVSFSLLCAIAAAQPVVTIQAVDRMDLPCEIEKLSFITAPEVTMAIGEYEPLALLVSATGKLKETAFRIEGLPRRVTVETRVATPYRRKLRAGKAVTEPYLLEATESVSFKEAGKAVYWLIFHAEPSVKAGSRIVTVRLADASLKLRVTVRPFRLRRDPGVFYGAFCGRTDVAITPAHMQDLHERGFDALQFFWGSLSLPIRNDSGHMVVDFSFVDRWMEEFQKAGMKGPIVWSLGNDSTSHTENILSQVFNIPHPPLVEKNGKRMNFADIKNPELNRRLKELMLAIKEHLAEKKWPQLNFIIYDEPTERLMEEHADRYRFIKSFWPELKIYGVVMDRLEWAQAVNPMADILVANGDFERISALAERSGKPFWLYGSASSRDEAALRQSYAWRPWVHKAKGVWFWAYNYHAADPYDDFDAGSPDSSMSMVWPSRPGSVTLVYSVSWEGMREAVDDMAYIQTLEWMLKQTSTARAREIQGQLEDLKKAIPSGRRVRVLGGDAHDTVEQTNSKRFVTEGRRKVATWIEEVLQADRKRFREIRVN